jgi:ribonuclease HII
VAVGAVCLPQDERRLKPLAGVNDSKMLTHLQRVALAERIRSVALAWGVGSASASEIDEHGLIAALKRAMQRALDDAATRNFDFRPDCLMLDAMLWPERRDLPQVSIVGGDRRSLSIAAASILAKTWRDDYMTGMDAEYPQYGFAMHKGYGSARHAAALREHGVCPLHRRSFAPVREVLENPSFVPGEQGED